METKERFMAVIHRISGRENEHHRKINETLKRRDLTAEQKVEAIAEIEQSFALRIEPVME